MKLKTICYSLRNLNPTERLRFHREMYGFTDISNKGRYTYKRQGLMNTIKYNKIYFSALVVDDKKAGQIIKILKKHKAKIHVTDFIEKKSL